MGFDRLPIGLGEIIGEHRGYPAVSAKVISQLGSKHRVGRIFIELRVAPTVVVDRVIK